MIFFINKTRSVGWSILSGLGGLGGFMLSDADRRFLVPDVDIVSTDRRSRGLPSGRKHKPKRGAVARDRRRAAPPRSASSSSGRCRDSPVSHSFPTAKGGKPDRASRIIARPTGAWSGSGDSARAYKWPVR